MFIKEIELTNFKSHTSSFYQFGKTNHFSGDNFAGKSSIGEAVVFCLFGMTKHGYKGYAKDYLQTGKTTMMVRVSLLIHDLEYIIVRTMNARGTTTVTINHEESNERDVVKIIGDYQTFIYCFFPDVFPEENKNSARSFLITALINDHHSFDDFEKAKSRITKQQKSVNSSITFYEGQKTILQEQLNLYPRDKIVDHSNQSEKKEQLLEELSQLNQKLEQMMSDRYQLQSKIESCKDRLKEIETKEKLNGEYCPTCHQKLPDVQLHSIQIINYETKNSLCKELEVLEIKLKIGISEVDNLLTRKKGMESEIKELNARQTPASENNVSVHQLNEVQNKLSELIKKKNSLSAELKNIKHQMGQLANQFQNQLNQGLMDTRIDLFKQLKSGELRPDFQVTYKNRPYRVLSNSEKIRCMLEIISLINREKKSNYPLFLDNLESVTHLNPPETQIITATVKKGMPLTLKLKTE